MERAVLKEERNKGIDTLKGVLIVLMIIGHILHGKVSDNFIRFIIYSFHMPLFIGMGGYLMAQSRTIMLSPNGFFLRLLKRPIWPWLIAMLAYSVLPNLNRVESFDELVVLVVKCFVFPYHHLWFIPAYLGWIIGTLVLRKLFNNNSFLLVTSLLISFFFFPVDHHLVFLQWVPFGESILHYIGRTFHLQFFFFFVLGFVGYGEKSTFPLRLNFIFLFLLLWLYSFSSQNEIWIAAAPVYFIFNFTFIQIFFQWIREKKLFSFTAFALIGKNTLPIYLWHIFPIVYAGLMFPDYTDIKFYLLAALLEFVLIVAIYRLAQFKVFDRYLFGNI
jgi:acyltransferase